MIYTKPEINTLGDADSVIQGGIKAPTGALDPCSPQCLWLRPAYDLDE
jgi:hypothetical protein